MKKFIFIYFLIFNFIFINAQEEHLTFKGIPIDGTIKEFVGKLRQKGFEFEEDYSAEAKNFITQLLKKYDINIDIPNQTPSEKMANLTDYAELIGDFAGYKDCHIGIIVLDEKDLVYKIGVLFPSKNSWRSIEEVYLNVKSMLTKKYGLPIESENYFTKTPQNDDDKYRALNYKEFVFFTKYKVDKGEILLEIINLSYDKNKVRLTYWDKTNTEIINSLALDDL